MQYTQPALIQKKNLLAKLKGLTRLWVLEIFQCCELGEETACEVPGLCMLWGAPITVGYPTALLSGPMSW